MKTIILTLTLVFIFNLTYADWTVKGKYKIKGNKTVYTSQLTRHTIGRKKPKKPIKGDTFEDKKTGKKEKWTGKKWRKSTLSGGSDEGSER